MHELILKILGKEKAHEFSLWAFGEDYEERLNVQLAWKWNERHSDIYHINYDNSLSEDIEKMIAYWQEETQHGRPAIQNVRRASKKVHRNTKKENA
jgi:hypothetical protein